MMWPIFGQDTSVGIKAMSLAKKFLDKLTRNLNDTNWKNVHLHQHHISTQLDYDGVHRSHLPRPPLWSNVHGEHERPSCDKSDFIHRFFGLSHERVNCEVICEVACSRSCSLFLHSIATKHECHGGILQTLFCCEVFYK